MNVYIMSGIPGSGKTYEAGRLAAQIHADGEAGVIVSADHFWHKKWLVEALGYPEYNGIPFNLVSDSNIAAALDSTNYNFDPSLISQSHHECFRAFVSRALDAASTIIVDNTNINAAEIAPYVLAGESYGYEVEIVRVETPLEVCLERNTHMVPREIVERMHHVFNARTHQGHLREHMPWWKVLRK